MLKRVALALFVPVVACSIPVAGHCEEMCPVTVWEGTHKTTQWVPCGPKDRGPRRRHEVPKDEEFGGMPDPRTYPPGDVDLNEWPSENEPLE